MASKRGQKVDHGFKKQKCRSGVQKGSRSGKGTSKQAVDLGWKGCNITRYARKLQSASDAVLLCGDVGVAVVMLVLLW